MRTIPALTFALLGGALFLAPALVAMAEDTTVEGEILDLACYIGRGAKGPSHTRCAATCAEHGMPLGLLGKDGKVYILYPKHGAEEGFDEVKTLAGQNAKLTGLVEDKDGLLGIEVHAAVKAE